jgi:hypothetical protein
MSTYLFIIGKDRELSLAELSARYPDGEFIVANSDFAVLETKRKINQSEFDKLGGVIKMGQVVTETNRKELSNELVRHLIEHHTGGKLNYGISLYGWSENP